MARKTKQEALETRAAIIDAAELLFQQCGVSHTSLQDIAQAAGVTRGAIYWHFKDKAELFEAMMARATMPLEEGMGIGEADAQLPDPAQGAPCLADLRWGLVNVFHTAMHNERTRRVFDIAMQRVEYTGEMRPLLERKLASHRDWRAQNQSCFEQAIRAGRLPASVDARVAAVALVALVDGLLHQWIMDPEAFDLVEVGQRAVEGFLNNLSPGPTPLLPPMTAQERARLGSQAICGGSRAAPDNTPPPPAADTRD